MAHEPHSRFERFPTTQWSLVGRAGAASEEALEELLKRYWPALKTHLVYRKRIDPHEADDLVQGFIESKILQRDLVERAEVGRGKFRTLLATALDNFVINELQKRNAQKRQADRAVPLDPGVHEPQLPAGESPTAHLDIAWGREVLFEAIERMRAECGHDRKKGACSGQDLWRVFEGRVLATTLHGDEPLSYEALMEVCQFESPVQASNALMTAKRTFARILRGVISEYATSPAEIDSELLELERALGKG